jgi:hypothetical protein
MLLTAIASVSNSAAIRQVSAVKSANDGDADDAAGASATKAAAAPVKADDGDADDSTAVSTASARSSASVQAVLSDLTLGG